MPTFLPITADTRSQRVRIARQNIAEFPAITYINLGQVDPPLTAYNSGTLTFTANETAEKPSLKKSKYYLYAITSVDSGGNESQPYFVEEKSGGGAEGAGSSNWNELEWNNVPHAVAYKVYASAVAGGAKEAISQVNLVEEVKPGTTTSKFIDKAQTRGTVVPPSVNSTQFNVGGGAFSTRKELQNHLSQGAIIVLGGYTPSNLDFVPIKGSKAWELVLESEQFKVVKAEEVLQRSTGRVNATVVRELTQAAFKSEASKEKVAIAVYNTGNGQLESLLSANEATVSIAKTISEKVKRDQVILYVLRTKGTTKEVENLTETYFGPASAPVVALGHATD